MSNTCCCDVHHCLDELFAASFLAHHRLLKCSLSVLCVYCPHMMHLSCLCCCTAAMVGLSGHCVRVPARAATQQELLRVHTSDHLQRLQMFCSGTMPATHIPSDTYINQHTLHCAALAAGSAVEVAVRVVQGQSGHGAAIIRPPGHHAESNTAMGFCFFNNAAVAARAAQAAGAERVLILDWDVHHGNGTQHIFEADPSVLYMSLHRYDRSERQLAQNGLQQRRCCSALLGGTAWPSS